MEIIYATTGLFMLHIFWSALGWGVLIQAIFALIARRFGYAPVAGASEWQVVWRMPAGVEWFTELFFVANSIASVYLYMSDATATSMHSVCWEQYGIAMSILLIGGIACELFPWLERRTNPWTGNVGFNLLLLILLSLLFP